MESKQPFAINFAAVKGPGKQRNQHELLEEWRQDKNGECIYLLMLSRPPKKPRGNEANAIVTSPTISLETETTSEKN